MAARWVSLAAAGARVALATSVRRDLARRTRNREPRGRHTPVLALGVFAQVSLMAVHSSVGTAGGGSPQAAAAPRPAATSPAARDLSTLHPNAMLVDSRAIRLLFTRIRDASTPPPAFAAHADRLMDVLALEGLALLPDTRPVTVATPCGPYEGLEAPPASSLAVVSIVRAGDSLLEAVRRAAPGVCVGKILIQRDEADALKRPRLLYVKLPRDIASKRAVLLVDPMLATGGSAAMAVGELVRAGVAPERIVFLNVVACPEGLAAMAAAWPSVRVVTAAVDARLNEHKYIVPGLGDFGDRYFGTT
jgi:uracil phosphoribosyltransferase